MKKRRFSVRLYSGWAMVGLASFVAFLATACAPSSGGPIERETLAASSMQDSGSALDRAFSDFVAAIAETAAAVRSDPAYADPEQRAAGALYWAQMLLSRIEADLIQEPDFPLFRVVDHRVREGADNADQRYLFSPIRGEGTYRIWGKRRAERRIEVQVFRGRLRVGAS
jgi:hypothetical protein